MSEPITTIKVRDKKYPELLTEIPLAPKQLFVRGSLAPRELLLVAVVGTRKCTDYGRRVTKDLVRSLVGAGFGIVSGLAYGIDATAHEAVLEAGGYTVAILPSSVDDASIYPSGNRKLARKILDGGGALVSENETPYKPELFAFPKRNRIIAGLAVATLVTEAPSKSGALITAKAALDYNRDVLAVPHPIYSLMGAGCNWLIAEGAECVGGSQTLLEALGQKTTPEIFDTKTNSSRAPLEEQVLRVLGKGRAGADELVLALKTESATVLGALTLLELNGRVRRAGGQFEVV